MTFLPIVERELRVAARRRSTYRTRLLSALVAIGLTSYLLLTLGSFGGSPAGLSASIFGTLTTLAFVYCLLAGTRTTADCLSEEKREGTLGLLFLTDLKGYDVVLGKLLATSLNSFYGLLAIFPVLGIPLLLGGVTASQFGLMALCLTNTLFFSLAVGMWISAISRHERRAMIATLLMILFFTAGMPLLRSIILYYVLSPVSADGWYWLLWPSPGYAFGLTDDSSRTTGVLPAFWCSILTTHLISWMFLLAGSFLLPRAWQDRPASAKASRRRENWIRLNYGEVHQRAAFRKRLLNTNPYLWLATRDRLKPVYLWGFLLLVAFIWGWIGMENWKDGDWWVPWSVATILLLHTVMKIWFTSEAGHQLGTDRHSGALELVLSTPLAVEDILRGQWLALQRQFAGPLMAVLLADLLFLVSILISKLGFNHGATAFTILAGAIIFIADLITLGWVGMWLGLSVRQTNRAIGGAVARILLLPWAIYIGAVTLLAFIRISGGFTLGYEFHLGLWFTIGILNDLVFLSWARRNLHRRFREVVTQRFDTKPERFWRRRSPKNQTQT